MFIDQNLVVQNMNGFITFLQKENGEINLRDPNLESILTWIISGAPYNDGAIRLACHRVCDRNNNHYDQCSELNSTYCKGSDGNVYEPPKMIWSAYFYFESPYRHGRRARSIIFAAGHRLEYFEYWLAQQVIKELKRPSERAKEFIKERQNFVTRMKEMKPPVMTIQDLDNDKWNIFIKSRDIKPKTIFDENIGGFL